MEAKESRSRSAPSNWTQTTPKPSDVPKLRRGTPANSKGTGYKATQGLVNLMECINTHDKLIQELQNHFKVMAEKWRRGLIN